MNNLYIEFNKRFEEFKRTNKEGLVDKSHIQILEEFKASEMNRIRMEQQQVLANISANESSRIADINNRYKQQMDIMTKEFERRTKELQKKWKAEDTRYDAKVVANDAKRKPVFDELLATLQSSDATDSKKLDALVAEYTSQAQDHMKIAHGKDKKDER